ncbi:ATP-binding cassette domain-containing protein [Aliifodinibius sp. S!AR15-10]|uniref:ATP-binding cassette domain-containing protein n=1 Tax=Aliifodinibius sp. S!AR15-10 TaxID=2950437 RepID=UPI002862C49B|nr:ATP-binding cassette domain-containing protein [Aliifodinibius sp. S!AR15-10]MDR8392819.1 ATP-binding cassette domain-containing protein [Aliifodinibius sp. S!AR15-10]
MSITVSNLTKKYGPQKAVDDISFKVKTGEILGFLGPNGAGKSTTMKIITCFISPTEGGVSLNGYNIHNNPRAVRSRIGYLPENTPLYTDMTIVDYLKLSARLQEMPQYRIMPRIREMIDVCGLGPEKHKFIGELSKGYRQRVGLAQALIHDPEVLILDEPTTGLDPNQIAEIRSLIKEIGKEKTVMLSSHILKEVEATCDRILIINKGKLVADGSTQELRQRAKGANQLLVQIRGANGEVGEGLLKLSSVAAVNKAEDGENMWLIDTKPDLDSREEVFRLCVENDWILTQMTPKESSLEDIFRELTEE